MSLEEIKSLARELSVEDRLDLMDDLSESLLAEQASVELSDEQRAELDRRLAEADANPDSLIPLEEFQRRMSRFK